MRGKRNLVVLLKKKNTIQEETDVRLYNFVGIKMRCSHSSSILNWQTMVWSCLHVVAFVGCKTWQILSDEALGGTLYIVPFLVVFVVNTCHSQLHILIDNGYHWTGQGSLYWQKIGQAFHYDAKSMALSEISFSLECIDCTTRRWICFWTLYTSCFDIELQGQGFSISIHLNM